MRSMATRRQHLATSEMLGDVSLFLKPLGFDMVLIETAGIGQSDSEIVDLVDFSMCVMTSEYGAASQLEKIDMIDFADMIVLNKFDKRGAEDALRDVRKQWRRNHNEFALADEQVPVYPTIASQFNDPGVNWVFHELCTRMVATLKLDATRWAPAIDVTLREPKSVALIPGARVRYLAEIAEQGRGVNAAALHQAELADRAQHLHEALRELADPLLPPALVGYAPEALTAAHADNSLRVLRQRYQATLDELTADSLKLLHTNAYDEAITTPTEESVRRAVAIQLVINRDRGLNFCENPWQGSFIVEDLTDLVEEAVYAEFERISERGGVLGAMDTMYQRSKIQEESLYYEGKKHDGSLPLIGVNTFLPPPGQEEKIEERELMRSSEDEKRQQIDNLAAFHARHSAETPEALAALQRVAEQRGNLFAEMMEAVKVASLGQVSGALYEVGGIYRRNM